jgi:hypothetical protein
MKNFAGKKHKNALTIEHIAVAVLKPYENNAKKHPEAQIELLMKNIEEFGFTTPILVDKKNSVIAGHGRLIALQRLPRERHDAHCLRKGRACLLRHGARPQVCRHDYSTLGGLHRENREEIAVR